MCKDTNVHKVATPHKVLLYMQDKSSRADSDIVDGNRNGVISWPPLTPWNWNWAWTPFPAKKKEKKKEKWGSEIKKGSNPGRQVSPYNIWLGYCGMG